MAKIKRESLARQRTQLANERTLLAHLRTSFAFFLFGIGLIEFFPGISHFLGWTFLVLGGLVSVVGIVSFMFRKNKIERT